MLSRPVQSPNAPSPMLVTLSGIVMLLRLLQSKNAQAPILVMLSGIIILLSLLQPLNAPSPMLVTLSGIVMLSRLLQRRKASPSILVTPLGIMTVSNVAMPSHKLFPIAYLPSGKRIETIFPSLRQTPSGTILSFSSSFMKPTKRPSTILHCIKIYLLSVKLLIRCFIRIERYLRTHFAPFSANPIS